jgi:subtilase family serine protease
MRIRRYWMLLILAVPMLLAACNAGGDNGGSTSTPGYSPAQMRDAYGVTSLYNKGDTGKGQTVVVIDSFGSPTLQKDMDTFCEHYGLPKITLQILAPLGTKPFDSKNSEMTSWVGETSEDVELIHAIAPDANITVLTSPVDETEGTVGLPQFLQLEQYAVSHHLGNIISQSWGASEYTLKDSAGQQAVQQWDSFYNQATTQQGITFFAGSGDNGATDESTIPNDPSDQSQIHYVPSPTSSFPNDDPWVSSVGGTTLNINGDGSVSESAWSGSGGGFSAFFSQPSYQQQLPSGTSSSTQGQFNNRRGLPDVAAAADPNTGLGAYDSIDGWFITNGTSAATPTWAAILAIGDQMAGHPLGFINPALYKVAASSSYAQDFRDITDGNNTFTGGGVSVQGYTTGPGWDPVTGLGAPIADHLLPDVISAAGH